MIRFLTPRALGLAILTISLAGYGVSAAPAHASNVPAQPAAVETSQAVPFSFLQNVGLTSAQTTKIQALFTRYQSSSTGTEEQSWMQKFQAAMLAPEVNQATLRALLTTSEERRRTTAAQLIPMFTNLREILTPTQRTAASQAILKQSTQSGQSGATNGNQTGTGGNMTAEQKALFKAAEPPTTGVKTYFKGLATLMTTGDTTALNAALKPPRSVAEQVGLMVKALSSLTIAQRKALFSAPSGQQQTASPRS